MKTTQTDTQFPHARFALFVCEHYYPEGGWRDLAGMFDTERAAIAAAPKDTSNRDWHVIDLRTGKAKYSQ